MWSSLQLLHKQQMLRVWKLINVSRAAIGREVMQTCWCSGGRGGCRGEGRGLLRESAGYVRREHLRLFLSFFLLLSPALEGDSSFSLAWLDSLEELCWLKWLGTWRASPPWEAKLALQPPTTHCKASDKVATYTMCRRQALVLTSACKITDRFKSGDV